MHVAAVWPQVHDRIADDLSRAVVRHVAAAASVVHADSQLFEPRIGGDDMRSAGAPDAKRDDRWMLKEKEKVRNTPGPPFLDKRLLQLQAFVIGQQSQATDFERPRVRPGWRRSSPDVP
jgi:hypothetical protein